MIAAASKIENTSIVDPNVKEHSIWAVIDADLQKLTTIYVLLREQPVVLSYYYPS